MNAKPRVLTLTLDDRSPSSAGSKGEAKAAGQSTAKSEFNTAGQEKSNSSPAARNGQQEVASAGNKARLTKAGTPQSNDHLLLAKGLKASASRAAQSVVTLKARAGVASARSLALIERIESLMTQAAKSKGSGALKMQLSESPFGKMDVQFNDKENRLSIVMESEKAKEAFLRLIPSIRAQLADKGFFLNDVRVSVGGHPAQEGHTSLSKQKQSKQTNTSQIAGKEGGEDDITRTVTMRKFGYNTLEVTA